MGDNGDGVVAGKAEKHHPFRTFLRRWISWLVFLYGLAGFLFYLIILTGLNSDTLTRTGLYSLHAEKLNIFLYLYAALHLLILISGVFLLIQKRIPGIFLFLTALMAVLLLNALIPMEANLISWLILLVLAVLLWLV